MANFYYQSESLGKVMYLADIEALSDSDLLVLEQELHKAIEDIKTQMYDQRDTAEFDKICLLYTSPSPRDYAASRMPSSA